MIFSYLRKLSYILAIIMSIWFFYIFVLNLLYLLIQITWIKEIIFIKVKILSCFKLLIRFLIINNGRLIFTKGNKRQITLPIWTRLWNMRSLFSGELTLYHIPIIGAAANMIHYAFLTKLFVADVTKYGSVFCSFCFLHFLFIYINFISLSI